MEKTGASTVNASGRKAVDEGKLKALEATILQIEKQHGKGAIMRLGDETREVVPVIPTGSISLDMALGVGGIPRGRITEIYGPESSGKTTLALSIVAEAQRAGGIAAFVDAEHALDPIYAKALGVDTDNLLVSQPDTGEQALEIVDALVRSGAIDVIVVDSVAALVPKSELDGEMGDAQMGLQARLMSQAMRKLTGTINKSRTSIIFINQIRMKIGVFFGSPETTTGGNALKFYSSVRMDIRRIETLKQGEEAYGNLVRVKVVKNKVAPPFRQCEFQIIFGKGISRESDLVTLAVERGIVEKSGTWYSFKNERIGQGKENLRQFLVEHPEISAEMERLIREQEAAKHAPAPAAAPTAAPAPATPGVPQPGARPATAPTGGQAPAGAAPAKAAAPAPAPKP
jgi:recombination protein RecA